MGTDEYQTSQTEALFSEVHKLIRQYGLPKTILKLKSINKNVGARDIEIYEKIITTVLEKWDITEKELYGNGIQDCSSDARRSAFVLIHKHLKYSHEAISLQFNKKRSTVTMSISEFKKIDGDDKFYGEFLQKHREVEEEIRSFINSITTKSKKHG